MSRELAYARAIRAYLDHRGGVPHSRRRILDHNGPSLHLPSVRQAARPVVATVPLDIDGEEDIPF